MVLDHFFLFFFVHLMKVGEGHLLDYGHNNEQFCYIVNIHDLIVFCICPIRDFFNFAVRAAVAAAGMNFVGVPQPKPLHGFLPNFQGMFTSRGSRAD